MITHLLFTNDCYIFTKIRNRDEENIKKNFLVKFSKALGQVINLDKSVIIFSNSTPTQVKLRIADYLNIK